MHQLRRQASFTLDRFLALAGSARPAFCALCLRFLGVTSAKSRATICGCFQFPSSFQLALFRNRKCRQINRFQIVI